jgi:hypothetical protein
MVNLINNANFKIKNLLEATEFVALHKAALEQIENKYNTLFTTTLQSIITKVGLMVSEVVISPKMITTTYLGSVDYLGFKILRNASIVKHLKVTEINGNANLVKHSLGSIKNVNIDDSVKQYNHLISEIVKTLGLSSLNKAKLLPRANTIFEEKKSIKYELIGPHRVEVLLAPFYELDVYEKVAKVLLTIRWKEHSLDKLSLSVKSIVSDKIIFFHNKIDMNSNQSFKVYLSLKNEDLINNRVRLRIFMTASSTYETGFIFKKTNTLRVGEKTFIIENTLREQIVNR